MTFKSESQGEKPAFLQMNQKGMMKMARPTRMAKNMTGSMVSIIFWTIAGSGVSCKMSARLYIENTPE